MGPRKRTKPNPKAEAESKSSSEPQKQEPQIRRPSPSPAADTLVLDHTNSEVVKPGSANDGSNSTVSVCKDWMSAWSTLLTIAISVE